VALLLAACSLSIGARAQPGSPGQAEQLFLQGRDLLDKGKVDEACEVLERSLAVQPALGTRGLLAHCHERQGRLATAWAEYAAVADLARQAGQPEREQVARDRAATLQKRFPTLRVEVTAPVQGFALLRDGQRVAPESWGKPLPLDPGAVEIRAEAPGHRGWSVRVHAKNDASAHTIVVPALERLVPGPAPAPVPAAGRAVRGDAGTADPPGASSAPASLLPGLVAGGIGVAGFAVCAVFGLRARSRNNASNEGHCAADVCDPEGGKLRDEAMSSATVATIGLGVGIAGVATGLVLLAAAGSDPPGSRSARVRVLPSAGAQSLGLALQGWY
jgi:hypothetical protein